MSEFDVYFWTRLDYLQGTSIAFTVVLGIALIFLSIVHIVSRQNDWDYKVNVIPFYWVFTVLILLCIVIPSSKEYAMIKVIPRIANSELSAQIQKDVPELYQIAMSALKEKIAPAPSK